MTKAVLYHMEEMDLGCPIFELLGVLFNLVTMVTLVGT